MEDAEALTETTRGRILMWFLLSRPSDLSRKIRRWAVRVVGVLRPNERVSERMWRNLTRV